MEELTQVIFEEPSAMKLSNSGIRIIKNRTLLAPGFWNGRHYTKEEIVKAYQSTNWMDKDVVSLIADHRDDDSKGRPLTIRDWLGFVSNQYLTEDGFVKGDLNLCDSDLALRLIDGKAPFGISPFVYGQYDKLNNAQTNFLFKNFAIVVEPACKEAYINQYLSDDKLNEKLEKISAFERIRQRMGMSVGEFYAVPRNPPSSSKLPIFDKSHVKNAMSRFNQTNFSSAEEKSKAKSKIISKGKGFGIEIDKFEKLSDDFEKDIEGLELDDSIETPEKKVNEEKKSYSSDKDVKNIELKGGKKMEEDKKIEEKVEETSDVKVEEPKVEEEVSEEKLVEQIAKLTEKLMNKQKITPEMAKMQKLESDINFIKSELKKLSEAKVDVKADVKSSEKLSAKPKTLMVSAPQKAEFRGIFKEEHSQGVKDAFQKLSSLNNF